MPTWGEILAELKTEAAKGKIPFDDVRRKYLALLYQKTGRNVILYATKWTQTGAPINPETISITDEDIQGLMEVIHGLQGPNIDLILHSPGGSPEATEAFVSYLRTKFTHVRVIVPQAAMSAATMLACSANSIVMGKHSSLGPIDPQMILETPLGARAHPAQAILDQFKLAKEECRDPKNLSSWLPILGQYGPSLLVECENAINLARSLVSEWLKDYMFSGKPGGLELATKIANHLSNHSNFKTHGRHIHRDDAKALGLIIEDLENDQEFQDLVLSVFHATTHTFTGTPAVKLIENHLGKAFVKQQQVITVQQTTGPSQILPTDKPNQ